MSRSYGPERIRVDRRTRSNRWRLEIYNPVPGVPKIIPPTLNIDQVDCLLLRIRLEECSQKLQTNQINLLERVATPDRAHSPEPEPIYDQHGKRINTREQRLKEKVGDERIRLIERAMAMNPLFRAPTDYYSSVSKRTKKLYVPYKEYPDYNFIGLIIGPRGNTQKRMERETGAKIVIRGKGSQKEGKGRMNPDEDELHVLITADNEEALLKAEHLVRQLLVPVDEGRNEHKRAQLRELAEINGTLRDRAWQEPVMGMGWDPANVECAICGDHGHITSDCPLKGTGSKNQKLDSEIDAFLEEIGEAPPPSEAPPPPSAEADDEYAKFMKSIEGASTSSNSAPAAHSAPVGAPQAWNANQMHQFPPGMPAPGMPMPGMPMPGMPGMQMHGMPGMPGMPFPGQGWPGWPPQPFGFPGQFPPHAFPQGFPPQGFPPQGFAPPPQDAQAHPPQPAQPPPPPQ